MMTQPTLPSPSSFTSCDWPYDVFLNFRGETREKFTSDLYDSLQKKGIHTFIDDKELRRGEVITPSLLKAIKESRIFVSIFSNDYASSTYCLEELVTILECLKTPGRLFLPVFYGVDPSQVRHQRGTYEEALAAHEVRFQDDKDKVKKWRDALRQAADVSGWHFQHGSESEYQFITKITDEISKKINCIPLHVAKVPVGLESRVSEVISLLERDSDERVNMVGIYGIGGIGKSTIARAVRNLVADQFDGLCFLTDIRRRANSDHDLAQLQETLLNEILDDQDIKVRDVYLGISIIKKRLQRKKVLLILDNVDKLKQLEVLAGGHDWFGYGSKIIITTRDKHLLDNHRVVKLYKVEPLNGDKALELFSWHAFKNNKIDPGYEDISKSAVSYAHGLPLALEVIGSHLFGNHLNVWESALEKYKKIPPEEIHKILRVSYDDLEEDEKGIFLDIACFFNSYEMGYVKEMLSLHGFHVENGIQVLTDRSLIKNDGNGCVRMHDLIQDMGREIVRQESTSEPGRRSRLWLNEDIVHVLEDNTGSDTIEVMIVDLCKDKEVLWSGEAFKKMKNLKILIIRNARFSQGPQNLPNSLRVLDWSGYPSPSLPSDFNHRNLVILSLPESCLKLFKLLKVSKSKSLSFLDFGGCKFLTELPSLSGAPNLGALCLDNCTNLVGIDGSVGFLDRLMLLSAQGCTRLEILVPCINLRSLETLDLRGCSRVESFPEVLGVMENTRVVYLDETAIQELPLSIGNLVGLQRLFLRGCQWLIKLPSSVYKLPKLEIITAYGRRGFRPYEDKGKVSSIVFSNTMHVSNIHGEFLLDIYSLNISLNNVIEVCNPHPLADHGSLPSYLAVFYLIKPVGKQQSVCFRFRNKFPRIGLICEARPSMDYNDMVLDFKFSVLVNGTKQFSSSCNYLCYKRTVTKQTLWWELQCKCRVEEVFSDHEWNQVEILCERESPTTGNLKLFLHYAFIENEEDFKCENGEPPSQIISVKKLLDIISADTIFITKEVHRLVLLAKWNRESSKRTRVSSSHNIEEEDVGNVDEPLRMLSLDQNH